MNAVQTSIDATRYVHEGWLLAPEGGAIHLEEQTAVVADVHLGYEWARGEAGDSIPAHSLGETIDRLARLFDRAEVRRLIVAGDLVESPRPNARTAADVRRLGAWLAKHSVDWTIIPGNHDRGLGGLRGLPIEPAAATLLAGWTIQHGDRPPMGDRIVMGHYHPTLRAGGFSAPCFLAGPKLLVLPAFSDNASGLDVATARTPRFWRGGGLRCLAGAGGEVLDFGPLDTLPARLSG